MKKADRFIAIFIIMLLVITEIPLQSIYAGGDIRPPSNLTKGQFFDYLEANGIERYSKEKREASYETYQNYGLVVYGNMHGDFKPVSDGKAIKNGQKGEYRYLGYTFLDADYTNSDFPPDRQGNDKPEEWKFEIVNGASGEWNRIRDNDIKQHMLTAPLTGNGATSPTFNVNYIGGTQKAKPLSTATLMNGFSVYTEHYVSGRKYYATFNGPPMIGGKLATCKIATDKTKITMKANEKEATVAVIVTAKANLTGYAKPYHINYIQATLKSNGKEVKADDWKKEFGKDTATFTKEIVLSRSNYAAGKTYSITLTGENTLESIFKDRDTAQAKTTIELTVEPENTVMPVVATTCKADPELTQYTSATAADTKVKVTVTGTATNLDKTKMKKWVLYARLFENTTPEYKEIYTTADIAAADFYFLIPKSKLPTSGSYKQVFVTRAVVVNSDGSTVQDDTPESCSATVCVDAPPPPPAPAPEIPPAPVNNPPRAEIVAPIKVIQGDDVQIKGYGTDDDGDELTYSWDFSPVDGVNGSMPNAPDANGVAKGTIWFSKTGTYTVKLTVSDGMSEASAAASIEVAAPIPRVILIKTGTEKENRKVSVDASASSGGSKRFEIESMKWTLTPIDGTALTDIKTSDSLTASRVLNLLSKKPGKYKVSCEAKNSLGYTGTGYVILNIAPDLAPEAGITVVKKLYRDPQNKTAGIKLTDGTASDPEETLKDPISKRVWLYAFDKNNDGSFADETWNVYENGSWRPLGLDYSELGTLNIDGISDGNLPEVQIHTTHVGKYRVELLVKESFGQETIPEFVTMADRRKSNTLSKPEKDKIIEVDNIAPKASLGAAVKKKKEVDVVLITDYTGQKLADMQTKLNEMKAKLMPENVDLSFSFITSPVKIGTQSTTLYEYARLARVTYHRVGTQIFSGDSGYSETSFDEDKTDTAYWEYGGYYPLGQAPAPKKTNTYTWYKEYKEESQNNPFFCYLTKFYEYHFYDPGNRANTEVTVKVPIYDERQSMGYSYWCSQLILNSFVHKSVSVDSEFTRTGNQKTDSLDIKAVNLNDLYSQNLRKNSDKYILFISDGASTDYKDAWGSTYSFGNLGMNTMQYITNAGASVYTVVPDAARTIKLSTAQNTNLSQSISLDELRKSAPGGGKHFSTGAWQLALEDIYLKYEKNPVEPISTYVLLGDQIVYDTHYSDAEGDLPYKINGMQAEQWKYDHDPSVFPNSENGIWPIADFSGKTLDKSVKQFNTIGKYVTSYSTFDDPAPGENAFSGYRRQSTGDKQLTLIVHRAPIASFTYTLNGTTLTLSDKSYDKDHYKEAGKGIAARRWKWKTVDEDFWHEGNPPATLTAEKTYIVSLEVQDLEGVWSEPNAQLIGNGAPPAVQSIPIADMGADKTTIHFGETYTLTDFSEPSEPHVRIVSWNVKAEYKDQNGVITKLYENVNLTDPALYFKSYTGSKAGTYIYTLSAVKDSTGVQSANAAKVVTVVVEEKVILDPGEIKFNPSSTAGWTKQGKVGEGKGSFPINVSATKPAVGGYTIDSIGVSGAVSQTVNGFSGNIAIEKEGQGSLVGKGSWTPQDVNTPEEPIGGSGVYKIDWTAPDVRFLFDGQVEKRGEQYEYMCDLTNTLKIGLRDSLSGVAEVRYLWTQTASFPNVNGMIELEGFTTPESTGVEKAAVINLHYVKYIFDGKVTAKASAPDYKELKKGLWYLHVYAKDRAGNEVKETSPKIFVNKLENFRLTMVHDLRWMYLFGSVLGDKTFVGNGKTFGVNQMPINVTNNPKYGTNVRQGYATDWEIDSYGFNTEDSKIDIYITYWYWNGLKWERIDTSYPYDSSYMLFYEKDGVHFYPLGEYLENEKGRSFEHIWMKDTKNKFYVYRNITNSGKESATWDIRYAFPYSRALRADNVTYGNGGSYLVKDWDEVLKSPILVNFEIIATKGGRKYNYTEKEDAWEQDPDFPNPANVGNRGNVMMFDSWRSSVGDSYVELN